ncbi:MAG: type IV secretory system conjugative DNA transfer family protein [Enterocloster sp.]|uniref:type IV secretory system conjugative DNA transfer family protein n=1 Tax=Enterocloster sp. TaxID=2719315 RepID=UPI0039998C87
MQLRSGSMKDPLLLHEPHPSGGDLRESLIISDPKSELYEKSSEYLRDQGYCVKVFNLVLPENSDSWNCLSEVEGQELMAQLFVDVIIKNTNSTDKGDHFWDSCEMNLLESPCPLCRSELCARRTAISVRCTAC